jgi:hypothetical protein
VYPLIANFSWDDVLYYLIPLIWVLQYFLPGKKKGEDEPDAPEQREAAEAAQERMRKIREEIRRRVEAQREGGAAVATPEAPAPRQTLVEPVRKTEERSVPRVLQPAPVRREVVADPMPTTFGQPNPQDELHERLREQKARLVEAKKAREAALRQTQKNLKKAKQSNVAIPSTGDLRSDVFATLQSPLAARKAILLSEILGEPRSIKPYS